MGGISTTKRISTDPEKRDGRQECPAGFDEFPGLRHHAEIDNGHRVSIPQQALDDMPAHIAAAADHGDPLRPAGRITHAGLVRGRGRGFGLGHVLLTSAGLPGV